MNYLGMVGDNELYRRAERWLFAVRCLRRCGRLVAAKCRGLRVRLGCESESGARVLLSTQTRNGVLLPCRCFPCAPPPQVQNENGSWGNYEKAREKWGDLLDAHLYLHTTAIAIRALIESFEEGWHPSA